MSNPTTATQTLLGDASDNDLIAELIRRQMPGAHYAWGLNNFPLCERLYDILITRKEQSK